jgi:hypothetical protein
MMMVGIVWNSVVRIVWKTRVFSKAARGLGNYLCRAPLGQALLVKLLLVQSTTGSD